MSSYIAMEILRDHPRQQLSNLPEGLEQPKVFFEHLKTMELVDEDEDIRKMRSAMYKQTSSNRSRLDHKCSHKAYDIFATFIMHVLHCRRIKDDSGFVFSCPISHFDN